ncbi:MAG: tRNA (adenosine(37)-N6)-threonylcarbamoyltransferase complex ATPase subunit type 1 TsaE [Candidatus Latescibacteria bacterium]|nr:tRNA (adenosine(37)-N6)-threonylcarbamoyltransferase complex ATPase subunit type 1 TsaE [Candidatus Latescibacterota bacterium]
MSRILAHTVRTTDAAETERFGAALGERIRRGACVCLTGPLGAGKTVFVKGLCRGLGAVDPVTSPTFILMESFAGRLPIVHVDLYRLEHEREVEDIGVFDMVDGETVVIAEWGERSPALLEEADLEIRIEPGEGTARTIHVHATPDFAPEIRELTW